MPLYACSLLQEFHEPPPDDHGHSENVGGVEGKRQRGHRLPHENQCQGQWPVDHRRVDRQRQRAKGGLEALKSVIGVGS